MGGDIIVNGDGRVAFTYYSKTNTDRPTVAALMDAVSSWWVHRHPK